MKVTVLTAIYGAYDTLKSTLPQDGYEVDWLCVTDDAHLASCPHPGGWQVCYQPKPDVHPNRAAKEPKMAPWRYTDAPAVVWIDASFRITSPTFVGDVLSPANPIAQFSHPWRDCVYDEAVESLRLPKYQGEAHLIQAQMEAYRREGFPEHWGLYATGVIARWWSPAVQDFGEHWLFDCNRWSFQDQLSECPSLRGHGLRPYPLPGTFLENRWLAYEASANHHGVT